MRAVIALTSVLVGIFYVNCDDIFGDDIFGGGADYTACGKNTRIDRATGFIIKNKNAQNPPGTWPWMVSMGQPDTSEGGAWRHICGGALVTRDVVVTAAHCCSRDIVAQILEGNMFIRAGDNHLQQDNDDRHVQVREVAGYERHPDYYKIYNTRYSDAAILRLAEPVELTAEVRTICLPDAPTPRIQDNHLPLVVTGWGYEELTKDQFGGELFDTQVQVYPAQHCNDTHLGQRNNENAVPQGFTSDLFCGGDNAGTEGVCQGDSGSPAVFLSATQQKYILKGIVSGGLKCGTLDYPNIFVRVSDRGILNWIYTKIGKTLPTTTTLPTTSTPSISNRCMTISGPATGSPCIFPFTLKGSTFHGCTVEAAPDGQLWCSTKVDRLGNHITGEGFWGHCGVDCGSPSQSSDPGVPQDPSQSTEFRVPQSPRGVSKSSPNCDYNCMNNGGCTVKYVGPSRPGKSKGSCTSATFKGICRGIPSECKDCNKVLACGAGAAPVATVATSTHTEDVCEYDCKANGGCSAKYIGPSRSGSSSGSCASKTFGSKCFGIPPECGASCHPFCGGK